LKKKVVGFYSFFIDLNYLSSYSDQLIRINLEKLVGINFLAEKMANEGRMFSITE